MIIKVTLAEAVRGRVMDIWGDEIARENGMYHEGVDDSMINRYIDSKSTSWLLDVISDALGNA